MLDRSEEDPDLTIIASTSAGFVGVGHSQGPARYPQDLAVHWPAKERMLFSFIGLEHYFRAWYDSTFGQRKILHSRVLRRVHRQRLKFFRSLGQAGQASMPTTAIST